MHWRNRTAPPSILRGLLTLFENSARVSISPKPKKQERHWMRVRLSNLAGLAAQHFGRSVSIFDLLGDRYRGARAHCELGRAYALAKPDRAAEHFARAANTFRELGARLDLAQTEEARAALDESPAEQSRRISSATFWQERLDL